MLQKRNKQERLVIDFKNYNKHARTFGFKEKTFEEYKALKSGRYRPKIKNGKSSLEATTMIRKSPQVPSGELVSYHAVNTDGKFYTGTLIKGISTLHKSNAVPVISYKEMEDHSKMAS